MHVWLDRVPLRDSTLAPEEILMSESQERMCAVVAPEQLDAFMAVCRKWDVEAIVIGEVTDSGRLTIDWHGEQIVDVPPKTVAHEGPVYERPFARPAGRTPCRPTLRRPLPRPASGDELRETLLQLLASARTSRRSRGSPTSTTGTCSATPCWPSRRTPASSGSTTTGSVSPSAPTATVGTASSTRTPVRSWRWPRPTATSRPPAPSRWR